MVKLSEDDDVLLACSCGHMMGVGIVAPMSSCIALEPKYDLLDIDYRYQNTFSYYGFHPDHREVSQAFK